MKRLWISVICLLAASSLHAQAKLILCNTGHRPFMVVLAYAPVHGILHKDYWVVSGWYTFAPGECDYMGPSAKYEYSAYRGWYLGVRSDIPGTKLFLNSVPNFSRATFGLFSRNASDRFSPQERINVCVDFHNAFEYQADALNATSCSSGSIFSMGFRFEATPDDQDNDTVIRLPINADPPS